MLLLMAMVFMACNTQPKTTFELRGYIEGLEEGQIILTAAVGRDLSPDTAFIENGAFVFTGDIPEPAQYRLEFPDRQGRITFYAENARMTMKAHIDSLMMRGGGPRIEGGQTQNHHNEFQAREQALAEEFGIPQMRERMQGSGRSSVEEREKFLQAMEKYNTARRQLVPQFIEDYPASHFSAFLIRQHAHGKSAVDIEDELFLLHPSLSGFHVVMSLREQVESMKEAEIGIENIITDAENLVYRVNDSFAGESHQGVVYMGIDSKDQIHALNQNGTVSVIAPSGQLLHSFQTAIPPRPEGVPSAITLDDNDLIYVIATLYRIETVRSRGQSREVPRPSGVKVLVYSPEGEQIRSYPLSENISGSGARIIEDRLLVADHRNRIIGMYHTETGEYLSRIANLRACCSILDFDVNENQEVLVANIGAFRVQGFDLSGKTLISFGQRGNGLDEFHGCCNPVSLAYLSNGGIVTVEKDPTRIKVYSRDGARAIEGIMELVEGCSYIPMVTDSQDNVYLASANSGIIQCSPVASDPSLASRR